MPSESNATNALVQDVLAEFRKQKRLAEGALAQLQNDELFFKLHPEQNSIWVVIKHMAGNMVSRWTDFLASDGEKPGRDRESEFTEDAAPRQTVMEMWEAGWACVFTAVEPLVDADLSRTITVRNERMSAHAAMLRQVAHYGYHIGQIVLLAKHIAVLNGRAWNYLTIAPGRSAEFNQKMGVKL